MVKLYSQDLAMASSPVDGPKSVAFSARPSKIGATAAVFECRFELSRPPNHWRIVDGCGWSRMVDGCGIVEKPGC